jgi:hypothetical protein
MRSRRSVVWLLVPAIVIFALTPLSRVWLWPADLPARLEAYIRPGNGLGVFQIFPWAGYVPFGAFLGSLLLGARSDAEERAVLIRFMAGGAMAAAVGAVGYFLDPNSPLMFWAGPYTSLLMRTGLMTAALAASKWVVAAQPASLLEPVILFGQTSLFVLHRPRRARVWRVEFADPRQAAARVVAGCARRRVCRDVLCGEVVGSAAGQAVDS